MSKKKRKNHKAVAPASVHVSQAADKLLAAHASRLDEAVAIMQMSAALLATDAEDRVTQQRAQLGLDAALRVIRRVSREIRDQPAMTRAIQRMDADG